MGRFPFSLLNCSGAIVGYEDCISTVWSPFGAPVGPKTPQSYAMGARVATAIFVFPHFFQIT